MIEKTQAGNRVSGFYRGIVLKHCENGKCKIFWPGVTPKEFENDPDSLPDAEQATPLAFSTSKNSVDYFDSGIFFYPNVGSVVWGFFSNEDVNFPVYFASSLASSNNKSVYSALKDSNSSEIRVNSWTHSLKITVNGSESYLKISGMPNDVAEGKLNDAAEISISLTKDGKIVLDAPSGNIEVNAQNISLNANGTLSLNSGDKVKVTSENEINVVAKNKVSVVAEVAGILLKGMRSWFFR